MLTSYDDVSFLKPKIKNTETQDSGKVMNIKTFKVCHDSNRHNSLVKTHKFWK